MATARPQNTPARARADISADVLTELVKTHTASKRVAEGDDASSGEVVSVATAAGDYDVLLRDTAAGVTWAYLPTVGQQGETGHVAPQRVESPDTLALVDEIKVRAAALEAWATGRAEREASVAKLSVDFALDVKDGEPIRCRTPNADVTVLCRDASAWLVTFAGLSESEARALLELREQLRGR